MRTSHILNTTLVVGLLTGFGTAALADTSSQRFSMGDREAIGFSVFMPKGQSGELVYRAEGQGNAIVTVRRCGQPTLDQSIVSIRQAGKLSTGLSARDRPPAHQTGCDYGIAVQCYSGGCAGTISAVTQAIGGSTTQPPGGTQPPATQPPQQPTYHGKPLAQPGSHIADAGSQNMSAAYVPYRCRIQGQMRQGDYDSFAFDFPGGQLTAVSYQGLNLVADLIRASDGAVLQRSGVNSGPFGINASVPAGRYILQVRVMHHAGSGPYVVDLGQPGSCRISEAR